MADAGQSREDLGQQRLVPRAVAEIGGDRLGDAPGILADRRFELGEIGAPLGERGRAVLEESGALPLEDRAHLVGCRAGAAQFGQAGHAHDILGIGDGRSRALFAAPLRPSSRLGQAARLDQGSAQPFSS
jgi:hypothetical protein